MGRSSDHSELIESVYTVALEPDRYEELTHVWAEHLLQALKLEHGDSVSIEDDLQRSLRILESLSPEDGLSRSRLKDFHDRRFAVLAVDAAGEVLEGNIAAVSAFGALEGTDLSILPYDEGSLEAITRAVKALVASPEKPAQMIRAIKTVCGGVSLVSVKAGHAGADGEPYALVQTSDFIWPENLVPLLETSFGLTRAESAIIRLMTEGCSLAMIAEERSSSLATVRSQVRSIFGKTGTHSQTELVRMAIAFATLNDDFETAPAFPEQAAPENAPAFEPAYPRAEDRYLLDLPDGRVLDYSIIGDPTGRPVLFTHCAFFGDVWTAKAVEQLKASRLKIIAPSRAFYQRSSPCPPKASPLQTYAEDVGHLISHLKLDRFAVMSRNIGSQFGFEIARQHREKVVGLLGLSPALPFKDKDIYATAEPNQRFLASAAFYFPKLLELFTKAGQIYYERVPRRKFVEKSFPTSKADFPMMDDPEIMAAIVQGLGHSGENSVKAFLHSYKDVRAHTYEMLADFDCPIVVMIGSEDQAPRRKHADDLYKDGGITEIIEIEGVGELLHYSSPEAVFAALDRLWETHGR